MTQKRARSIREIREAYDNKEFESKIPFTLRRDKLKEDHVINEDKSVKWNREQVALHNKKIDDQIKQRQIDSNNLQKALTDEIILWLQQDYELNEKQAELVYGYAYQEYHSYMGDFFINIEEIADMIEKVIEFGK